ncbi:hypothetical protein [Rhodoferax ferrireducens]|uniref:hypothetical protein n=1 Tax=Rhodoferax ferrireducens TaxID=192843 RepID=UPI000E0E02B3|nr:hypothetical protein [Rhodoferax ferrireducens]
MITKILNLILCPVAGPRVVIMAIGLFLGHLPTQAMDLTGPIAGIHVHRSGNSAHLLNAANETIKALKHQCQSVKSVCAMLPAGASRKDAAACAKVAGGFNFKGNLADLGKLETDEYFATGLHMATRLTEQTSLLTKSVCDVEVVAQTSTDIWHYGPKTYTHFELKNNPKKGRYWIRTEHQQLSPEMGSLLVGVFPVFDMSTVSPGSGYKTYAGHRCELREITGPVSGTFCLKATNTPFPGHVRLAGSLVSARDKLLREDHATEASMDVMLPRARFFPPEGDKVENTRTLSTSPENPTQKWCAKQKAKTGINPCEAPPVDAAK